MLKHFWSYSKCWLKGPGFQVHPNNESEIALSEENQKYLFEVFEKVLQEDQGKALVCNFMNTYDSQSGFRDLRKHDKDIIRRIFHTILHYICLTRRWLMEVHNTCLDPSFAVWKYEARISTWNQKNMLKLYLGHCQHMHCQTAVCALQNTD